MTPTKLKNILSVSDGFAVAPPNIVEEAVDIAPNPKVGAEVLLGAPKVEVLLGAPNAEVPLDRDKDGAAGASPSSEGVFVAKLDNPIN